MTFANWIGTLPGVLAQGLIWGILAIGVFITFKILDFADMTVDGSVCTGAAVCAVLVGGGMNIWLALLFATVAGMAAGFITGILHTALGIPAILSGILTQLMLWSVNLIIMGKANIPLSSRQYDLVVVNTKAKIMGTNIVLALVVIAVIALLYWFFGTEVGASLRATGNNIAMSRAQGINTNLTKVIGLVISNGIVAFAGGMLAQFNGAADINMGRGAIVIGLAAIIMGEAIFSRVSSGFVVRLGSAVVGAILYYLIFQTVIFFGLKSDYLKMLSAIVVVLFLGAPYIKKSYLTSHKGGKKNA